MKRFISLLALTSVLSPWSGVNAEQPFTGFNGGVNLGFLNMHPKIIDDSTFRIGSRAAVQPRNVSGRFGETRGIIGFSLSYMDFLCPCWNWGVEARANFSNFKNSFSNTDIGVAPFITVINDTFRFNQSYGLLAKLGYLVRPESQIYGFIGPQWGHFKISVHTSDTLISPSLAEVFNGKRSHTRTGYLLGFGFEQMVNPCMSLGMEYNYSYFGNVINNGIFDQAYTSPNFPNEIYHREIQCKVSSNSTLLKLNYYFC
jgi:opacity protein-like surface antigen